jgi:hypothetical protein
LPVETFLAIKLIDFTGNPTENYLEPLQKIYKEQQFIFGHDLAIELS